MLAWILNLGFAAGTGSAPATVDVPPTYLTGSNVTRFTLYGENDKTINKTGSYVQSVSLNGKYD